MEYTLLLEKIAEHYKKKLPFVVFSLPDSESILVYLQNDKTLYTTEDFKEKSFVFAPFNYTDKAICIPEEKGVVLEADIHKENILQMKLVIAEDISEKENYCQLVENTINAINSSKISKIVVSRNIKVSLDSFQITKLIERLFNLYPTAFSYVWYHPKTSLWCGASPELLVKTEGPSFTTMALAGTQKYKENIAPKWSFKEIEEQQLVVDDISTRLQKVTAVVKISKTYNHRAASLIHLRTDITGILKKRKTTLSKITSTLHPTPAVCGTPQNLAKLFILENEGYNREFYTGFLGPICENDSCSKLFVNLRCMKIENDSAKLFAGAGITKTSKPKSEWLETQHKLETMLQVLQPML